jgi:hypothetical protein
MTDAEIIERARRHRQLAREHLALRDALGTRDADVVEQLHAYGLRPTTAPLLLDWLPVVEVAWLDGADDRERTAIRTAFERDDRATAEALTLLDHWLAKRPAEGLFLSARRALADQLAALSDDERQPRLARILDACERVGRITGGFFGAGALSALERRSIDALRAELAGAP